MGIINWFKSKWFKSKIAAEVEQPLIPLGPLLPCRVILGEDGKPILIEDATPNDSPGVVCQNLNSRTGEWGYAYFNGRWIDAWQVTDGKWLLGKQDEVSAKAQESINAALRNL